MQRLELVRACTFFLAASLPAIAGCAANREGIYSEGPQEVRPIEQPVPGGEYVQAGATLRVRLNKALSTQYTTAGDRWSGTVVAAVRAPDGNVIVREGATLWGTVVKVEDGENPSIEVRFDSIDTVDGRAPIKARIASAEKLSYVGGEIDEPYFDPWAFGYEPYLGFDGAFYPYPGRLGVYGPYAPRSESREIFVPEGATLVLQLTRPLLPSQSTSPTAPPEQPAPQPPEPDDQGPGSSV